jgi:hypothetical protein
VGPSHRVGSPAAGDEIPDRIGEVLLGTGRAVTGSYLLSVPATHTYSYIVTGALNVYLLCILKCRDVSK